MNRLIKSFICALFATHAAADGEPAGEFDYYVMSLTWTPNWCALEGDDRGSQQCDPAQGYGFTLHGLWPQYEQGWPSYCTTINRDPSRAQTRDMADISGSAGLVWYEWKKHGRCSGLSAAAYVQTARRAYESINRPNVFRQLNDDIRIDALVVQDAFLEVNPALSADQITITCKNTYIQEVRICLTKDLELRDCGADVVVDCTLRGAQMFPIR